ncbi:hypothetical protein [Caldalkalibacillus mannanilyticus]|uniref:hypothetical protein n=1 Tax=Caldalkalibacillus mannanilyticus TaxID=1418 RepID=UPI0004690185|nr:hypothetical protein [Caldalkalibacillus mannanilyticus]
MVTKVSKLFLVLALLVSFASVPVFANEDETEDEILSQSETFIESTSCKIVTQWRTTGVFIFKKTIQYRDEEGYQGTLYYTGNSIRVDEPIKGLRSREYSGEVCKEN